MDKQQYQRLLKLRQKEKLTKGESFELEHLERVLEKYGCEVADDKKEIR